MMPPLTLHSCVYAKRYTIKECSLLGGILDNAPTMLLGDYGLPSGARNAAGRTTVSSEKLPSGVGCGSGGESGESKTLPSSRLTAASTRLVFGPGVCDESSNNRSGLLQPGRTCRDPFPWVDAGSNWMCTRLLEPPPEDTVEGLTIDDGDDIGACAAAADA